ncbi:MAG TPA: GGDEF domain-containing protein [Burkholderiaceae bacterium]|nr:GGDEF domain-containing protein [Burkholderiaceae bacterium]
MNSRAVSASQAHELEQVIAAVLEGRSDTARHVLAAAIERARADGVRTQLAQLLGRLARLEIRVGDYSAADAHAIEAAKLHAVEGDAAGQVAALTTAVLACTQLRRYDDAYAAAFAAHDVAPSGAGPELHLMATRALGAAHAAAGSYEEALQLFARMIDIARESNLAAWERTARTDWLVINLGWLTDPAALLGSAPDREHLTMLQSWAEHLLQQLTDGSPELQLRERANHFAVLAQIHVALGNVAAARAAVDAVMRDAVQLAWTHGIAEGSVVEADVCLLEGAADRGVELARRGIELAQKFDLMVVESKAHDTLARCAEAAGDHATAVRALRRHMQVTREILRLRSENRVRIERWRESQKQRERLDSLTAEATSFRELSLQDPLTGLANRRAIEPVVHGALAELRIAGRACALAMLDIDDFKSINDRHSHVVGDGVLRGLGEVMRAALRGVDFAARTGGDEIVILFSGASEPEARAACDRIRRLIAEHDWNALSPGLAVTMSTGVTAARADDSFESLMRRADGLMYQHKAA